jgi:hypothetical protein
MPSKVIVRKRKNLQHLCVAHHRLEDFHPMLQVVSTVNYSFVPGRGLVLDALAVTKPTHIGKICRNKFNPIFHFPRPKHKRCISQGQCDIAFAEQICQLGVEPNLVSNFDGEAIRPGLGLVLGRNPNEHGSHQDC